MRTVKFRYKCKNHDKLFYDSDPNFAYITQHNIIACCDGGMRFVEDKQEFIGKQDVHKKDIYEGDIVVVPGDWTYCIEDYGKPDFAYMFSEGVVVYEGTAWTSTDPTVRKRWSCIERGQCIVIGNVVENPELFP